MTILQTAILAMLLQVALPQSQPPGSFRGVIRRSDSGGPLANATVELRRVDRTAPQSYSATSDGSGRFVLLNVRPGDYQLRASHSGYLPADYGQRRLGGGGVSINIGAGQTVENIEIVMTQAGVISGRIRDREGDPVGNAEVRALTSIFQDGQRVLKSAQVTSTDDLGDYRLFGLVPGQYYLGVTPGGGPLSLRQGLVFLSTAQDGFIYNNSIPNIPSPAGTTAVPIYYPGTADARAAKAIELNAGANQGGVNFIVAPVQTRHVRGTVPGGSATVTLTSLDPAAGLLTRPNTTDAVSGPFDFTGVAPGTYILIAHSAGLSGSIRIEVRDADVDNVVVAIGDPIIIPTHVSFEGHAPSQNDPDLEFIRLNLIPDPPVAGISGDTYGPFPNGSMGFEVMAGEGYRIKLSKSFDANASFQNAYIKSIQMGKHDVLNEGLQYPDEPDPKIEIVIGLKPGGLTGTVVTTVNNKQQPVINTTVVLVPDTARRRRSDLYKTMTTDNAGRFQMDQIPPGDYSVFAWDDVENGVWQDPDFIRLYEDRGTPVHIGDGTRAAVTVPLISPQRQ